MVRLTQALTSHIQILPKTFRSYEPSISSILLTRGHGKMCLFRSCAVSPPLIQPGETLQIFGNWQPTCGLHNRQTVIKGITTAAVAFVGQQTDWMTDWLSDLMTDWMTDCLLACLTDWLTDWMTEWMTDWRNDWLTDWRNDWLNDWLTERLTDCLT
jgi:hypothetical protein